MVVQVKAVDFTNAQFLGLADLNHVVLKDLTLHITHVVAISMGMFHQCQKENQLVSNLPSGEFQMEFT
jgi:hypothetical protein